LYTAVAIADVKKGVTAWSAGDFVTAVKEWQDPAINGDVDAQYNLGQAYKFGRGVKQDDEKAQVWFGLAASQGHLQAITNYGLMLFKNNKRQEAMPFLEKSAERGDPRSQYIVGTAYFNGELVRKDYVKAFALMSLAAESKMPQALKSLQSMQTFLPEEEQNKATALADSMKLGFR
jgi:TPR repeat protein